jgi:hypothetical protein
MAELAVEYCCLVFIAAVGVFQAAAAHNELRGLSFFSRKTYGYLFALLTTGPALAVFFQLEFKTLPWILEGPQQFGLFTIAVATALIVTLVASSLLKHSQLKRNRIQHEGLEALKEMTPFQALRNRFSRRHDVT